MVGDSDRPVKRFLIQANGDLKGHLGGCPVATTLLAWSTDLSAPVVCELGCKRWGCAVCGRRKVQRLASRVERAEPNKFITLTCWPKPYRNPRDAYDQMRRKFSELNRSWRNRVGEVEYAKVLEVHKNGYPHWHLAARCGYTPQAWLSDTWARLTQSKIVDIRKVRDVDDTYRYMIKYLSKQKHVPWTSRRVSWTRGFFREETKPPCPWGHSEVRGRSQLSPARYLQTFFAGSVAEQQTPTAWLIDDPTSSDQPIASDF